ncbi:MAG: MFS transporter [Chloroflexota bacterium]|nr:MFS transporter [Chloroflexota bacterium]
MATTTAVAPPTGQEGRTKNSVLATTLIGAHAFEHLYAHSIPLLAPIILADLGVNATLGLLIPAIRSIFGGVSSTVGGFFVDLYHHRVAWVLSISAFSVGLGYLLMSVAPSYVLILAALSLGSIGSAMWHPPALGLLARRFPDRRGEFISLHRSMGSIGDAVSPLALGAFLGGVIAWEGLFSWDLPWGPVNWRLIVGFSTVIMFTSSVIILLLLKNAGGEKPEGIDIRQRFNTNWQGMKDAFRGTGMWAIFTVSAVRGMADRSYVFLVPLYLAYLLEKDGYHVLDPYVVTLLAVHVALMVIPGIFSGPIIGAVSDRIGRKLIIVFVMALTTFLTLATIMSTQVAGGYTPLFTILIAIYGTFNFSVNNLTQAAAADIAVGRRLESSFLGLMWGNNTLFGAISAVLIFFAVQWFGWELGFYISAAIYFFGLLISFLIPNRPKEMPQAA